MENKILIIDIETTGFLSDNGKIVEVGIVELDIVTGEKKILFDSICHERPITLEHVENSWIVKNSDLTVEQIRQSKQLKDLIPEIQSIINKYTLGATAFNNVFDFGFLENRGVTFHKKLECPMKLSTNILKIQSPRGFKWPNVNEAYKFFYPDVVYDEKHRGADDAFHEADIVFSLIKLNIFEI
jgi:DNA polymerase-3 subunit epsilon